MTVDATWLAIRARFDAGEESEAIALARRERDRLVAQGDPPSAELVRAHAELAELLYLGDRDLEGRREMEASLALARELGLDTPELQALGWLAEMTLSAGRTKDAHDYLYDLATIAASRGEMALAASAIRRHGEMLALLGAPKEALEALEWARRTYEAAGDAAGATLCAEQARTLSEAD